jgi:hypothetical protein
MSDDEIQEEEDPSEELLGFYMEDRHYLRELRSAVQKLIEREDTTPQQIHHLAKLLLAIDGFPRPTKGVALEMSLGIEHANGEKSYQDLYVDDRSFRVGNGAWLIVDESIGGDSTSETILEVEVGGYRDLLHPTAFADWVEGFSARVADAEQQLEISDNGDGSEVDWNAKAEESDWEKLGSDYV